MKYFTLLFLLCTAAVQAQTDHCDKFTSLLDKAKTLWAQKKFEDAFAKLSAAREACPGKAAEVDDQYATFIRDIANKYETADVKTREAKREAERAAHATRVADRNAAQSDSTAKAAERAARRAYANDMAYKSTIALRDGDRTAAFRLAEFAHRYVDDDNLNVTNALVQAIYYNEDSTHSFLPWASNLEGHSSSVFSVAFSPDGKKLATGSEDKSAKIWDLESGKEILRLNGHISAIYSVAFSSDGKKLATGSSDDSAKIWDLESGKDIRTLNGHTSAIYSVAFSPDGTKLATGSFDKSAKIWDLESGKEIHTLNGHSSAIYGVAFSLDGKKIATASTDKSAKIWDLESGIEIRTLNSNSDYFFCVAFSPDGNKLATGSSEKSIKIWDLESGNEILTLKGHSASVRCLAFSPDGKKLATGSEDKSAKIWDLESDKDILTLSGHSGYIYGVAFSSDGKKIATASQDKSAKIWDLELVKDNLTLNGHGDRLIRCVVFSPDGKKLATGSYGKIAKIWDIESGKEILTFHTSTNSNLAFSPDGKKLATSSDDDSAKIWDLESGKEILSLNGSDVSSVAFSPDGKKLATGFSYKSAKIWDLESGKDILTLEGHTSAIWSVAFSPDGKKLATGSSDYSAKIWDLESGKNTLTLNGHSDYIYCVAFSPDGKKLATASEDNTAKIWDLESGKNILTLEKHGVYCVAFSPNGKNLATGSFRNSAIIWDLESGKDILTLKGHTSAVRSVAFSPDGKKLATGSDDNSAKIWDLTPEGWMLGAGKNRLLAGLIFPQLSAYNLSGLLDMKPGNEEVLRKSKDPRQMSAFAELYAQNTRNSRDLRRTVADYARAERLYGYALESGGDAALLSDLGELYRDWASDILQSNRPDTASRYIELACRLYVDKRQCPELWDIYAQKTGQAFDFNQFLVSDHVTELQSYGDYFFEKEKWTEAKQLYEKAESLQHSREVLQNLYLISEKTGEVFDFQRFSVSGTVSDLDAYATFLIGEAEFNQKWSTNWVPNYQNGLQLREKQIRLDTTAALPARMSREYTGYAHKQIFLSDGKAAEASVRRAFELDPTNIYTHMLLAPSLLLQGKYEEAEIEYKKWAPLPFNSPNTFRATFLSELERMEREGLMGIDYARVRAWLEEKN